MRFYEIKDQIFIFKVFDIIVSDKISKIDHNKTNHVCMYLGLITFVERFLKTMYKDIFIRYCKKLYSCI